MQQKLEIEVGHIHEPGFRVTADSDTWLRFSHPVFAAFQCRVRMIGVEFTDGSRRAGNISETLTNETMSNKAVPQAMRATARKRSVVAQKT